MKYKSIATWPEGTTSDCYGRCRSEDTHTNKDLANAVCWLLNRDGFAGEGKIFPLKTWVEEFNER